ncbi:T9SS type A sorting domain-containing protein [Wenyingzhuangia sp. 1_MG-2023]|nr:T9SS type A sorting domain-containing protein [Wenyingzhuangia sp. 1_MG-2023]
MKTKLLILTALIMGTLSSFSQSYDWYNSGTGTSIIDIASGGEFGVGFVSGQTNPVNTGIYTETTASKLTRYGSLGANSALAKNGNTLRFTTFEEVIDASKVENGSVDPLIVKIKVYVSDFANVPNTNVKMHLRKNNNASNQVTVQATLTDSADWVEYTFDYSTSTHVGTLEDEYNTLVLTFEGAKPEQDFEYFLDDIKANVNISTPEVTYYTWYNSGASTSVIDLASGGEFGVGFVSGQNNPAKTGIYTENTASKLTRYGSGGANAADAKNGTTLRFTTFGGSVLGANVKNGSSDPLIIKLKMYVGDFDNVPGTLISAILRKNNSQTNQITSTATLTDSADWVEYTFNFYNSSGTVLADEDEYNTLVMTFSGTKPVADFDYYLDDIVANMNIGISLSVDDNNIENHDLKLFPNPVSNTLYLNKETVSAEIYNFLGKKLMSFKGLRKQFDVSVFPEGVYILKTNFENGSSKYLRFIKK